MGRILELNLGTFDPTSTPQYTDTEQKPETNLNAGDVVWKHKLWQFWSSMMATNGMKYMRHPATEWAQLALLEQ